MRAATAGSSRVMDLEDAVAVAPRGRPAAWADGFNDVFALVAGDFTQDPSRRRARLCLLACCRRRSGRMAGGWLISLGRLAGRDAAAAELLLLVR
jgi:hypothetical protein